MINCYKSIISKITYGQLSKICTCFKLQQSIPHREFRFLTLGSNGFHFGPKAQSFTMCCMHPVKLFFICLSFPIVLITKTHP